MSSETDRCFDGMRNLAKRMHVSGKNEWAATLETYVNDLRKALESETEVRGAAAAALATM